MHRLLHSFNEQQILKIQNTKISEFAVQIYLREKKLFKKILPV